MKNRKKVRSILLLLIMLLGLLSGCKAEERKTFQKLEDFAQARIGVLTGSSQVLIVKSRFPQAERVYFSRPADMVLAVEQGKIDGYMFGSPFLVSNLWEKSNIKRIEEAVAHGDIAFAFPKEESSDPLREQLNGFLKQAREDGTLAQLEAKWLGKTEPTQHPDYTSLTGENGTIRLAAVAENKPLIYQYQNQCTGYEMEILTLFAQQYGYRFDVEIVPFESVIIGMATGKYDMTSASLQITPEREENVNFSDPYMQFDVVMVVKGDGEQSAEKTLADLDSTTIGIVTGTTWDEVAQKTFPNAERKYFNSDADIMLALKQGKIDVLFEDRTVYAGMRWEDSAITCIDEPIAHISNALILPKEGYNEVLLEQINAFIAQAKGDGTLEALSEKWFGDAEPAEHPDYTGLTGENGTLRIAIGDSSKPTAYRNGTLYTGYEVDFLTQFAQAYGYRLDMQGMTFDALIPTVASGKCDIGACGITITAERAESVTFADSHFETYGVAVLLEESAAQSSGRTLSEFEHATIGIQTGSIYELYAKELFPDAECAYYNLNSDMMVALEQGKIDGFISETTYLTAAIWEGAKIKSVTETINHTKAAYVFQKGESSAQLREQLNAFIRKSKENGTIDNLREKWLGATEPTEMPDYNALTGENGTLRVAVAPDVKPITYMKDGEPTGYEIELLTMFAKEYGYKLDISYMSFDAVLPGVTTGKYDIGTGAITITEERAESLDFSESHLTDDVIMVIKAEEDTAAAQHDFWSGAKESFHKTFIRESRWKLIVEGIGVTMLISICAAIAGSLLGFGLYMLSRSDAKLVQTAAKGVARVYSRFIAGTPVVVILMILFYVVFGRFQDMSGIVVAIIGFALTFGAFFYDHMTVSVNSVDRGQTEAAYSLGYPKNKAFFRIVFPQAMTIFLPSYCGQAVELIKATAVVGYIAVNDLTKMGDIIRSNTYEAFFPLIATAVIYFLLTWLMSLLLNLVKLHFEPKRRKKEDILKGIVVG